MFLANKLIPKALDTIIMGMISLLALFGMFVGLAAMLLQATSPFR